MTRLPLVEWLERVAERQLRVERLGLDIAALVGSDERALEAAMIEAQRRGERFLATDSVDPTVAGLQSVRRDLTEGLRIGAVA